MLINIIKEIMMGKLKVNVSEYNKDRSMVTLNRVIFNFLHITKKRKIVKNKLINLTVAEFLG
jgi:hypothetical protein